MKFEEASLTDYLVKDLGPLTEANPVILAKYVVALLKKDKPVKELQKLCTDNLVEFLGNGAKSFTTKLFQALEDGSIIKVDGTLDATQISESSETPIREGTQPLKNLSLKEENLSTSSESSSNTEDKEVSDDDDADRNHKHRRREARPNSFETDTQEQFVRRPNKKRNKLYANGQVDIQTTGMHKEYNPNSGRNISSNFDNHRANFASLPRVPFDLGPHTRFNQPHRGDIGPRFDLSTSVGRPIGRGRGRGAVPWNQHDSRFNPHDTLDFDLQMASQGPARPSLFAGTGLTNAASTQTSSWAGFGFIPRMPNGIMDPLNPLGFQRMLLPTINPPLSLAMPRQRCKDFEERGFCLRGDMCPMEHGLNRIVVEDVQSLSQFNLPVSIPSSHGLGIQAGSGPLPVVPASSDQLTIIKSISNKSHKSGVMDDAANLNDIPSTSIGGDADVYDPDQPLWNNDRSDASAALLRLPSSNIEDEPSWDGIENEDPSRRVTGNSGSLNTSSSVWGRIRSGNKSDGGKFHNTTKEDHEDAINSTRAFSHGRSAANMEIDSKTAIVQPFSKSYTDSGHKSGWAFHKALRTLYVNGVPQKSNRRDELISHFKQFGEVIDIYIPLNSEKAFVQFSKREEAEAALKSPNAVMGNRFIKLSWANRDRILDDGQSSGHNTSVQSPSVVTTPVPSKQTAVNGGKGILPISAQKINCLPATERPMAAKSLMSNSSKAVPPTQKKPESLGLLEELRKKQESLAKKREEFKRQLQKFEKQAISSNKVDVIPEQSAKRQKGDVGTEANKAASPKNLGKVDVKTPEKKLSEEVLSLNGLKANSKQQSLKSAYQTSSLPASLPNRYKLDNRSTTFRILPPLPAGFANVTVLKDHFSHYGVISSVVLEDPDHIENEGPCKKCSVRITFATRHSAERAYQTAKCWDGHNLQFKWLTVSQNFRIDCGIQETSSSSPKHAQSADFQLKPVTSGSSSSGAEKLTCSVISEVATIANVGTDGNTELKPVTSGSSSSGAEKLTCSVISEVATIANVGTDGNTEGTHCPPISMHKSFVENSQCGPPISSHKESPDALMDEDGINLSSAL